MVLFISSREKFHTDGQTAELEESLLHGSAFFAQVLVSGANKNLVDLFRTHLESLQLTVGNLAFHDQSSSVSRFTAGLSGFFTLIQCLDRPDS